MFRLGESDAHNSTLAGPHLAPGVITESENSQKHSKKHDIFQIFQNVIYKFSKLKRFSFVQNIRNV